MPCDTFELLLIARDARDAGRLEEAEEILKQIAPEFEHRSSGRRISSRFGIASEGWLDVERDYTPSQTFIARDLEQIRLSDYYRSYITAAQEHMHRTIFRDLYRFNSSISMWYNPRHGLLGGRLSKFLLTQI